MDLPSLPIDLPILIDWLDRAVRHDLRAWRDTYFDCLVVATFLVAIGVALEGLEYLPIRKEFLDSSSGLMRVRFRATNLLRRAEVLGWIMVAIGVVGEFGFEPLFSQADERLQSFNDILFEEG